MVEKTSSKPQEQPPVRIDLRRLHMENAARGVEERKQIFERELEKIQTLDDFFVSLATLPPRSQITLSKEFLVVLFRRFTILIREQQKSEGPHLLRADLREEVEAAFWILSDYLMGPDMTGALCDSDLDAFLEQFTAYADSVHVASGLVGMYPKEAEAAGMVGPHAQENREALVRILYDKTIVGKVADLPLSSPVFGSDTAKAQSAAEEMFPIDVHAPLAERSTRDLQVKALLFLGQVVRAQGKHLQKIDALRPRSDPPLLPGDAMVTTKMHAVLPTVLAHARCAYVVAIAASAQRERRDSLDLSHIQKLQEHVGLVEQMAKRNIYELLFITDDLGILRHHVERFRRFCYAREFTPLASVERGLIGMDTVAIRFSPSLQRLHTLVSSKWMPFFTAFGQHEGREVEYRPGVTLSSRIRTLLESQVDIPGGLRLYGWMDAVRRGPEGATLPQSPVGSDLMPYLSVLLQLEAVMLQKPSGDADAAKRLRELFFQRVALEMQRAPDGEKDLLERFVAIHNSPALAQRVRADAENLANRNPNSGRWEVDPWDIIGPFLELVALYAYWAKIKPQVDGFRGIRFIRSFAQMERMYANGDVRGARSMGESMGLDWDVCRELLRDPVFMRDIADADVRATSGLAEARQFLDLHAKSLTQGDASIREAASAARNRWRNGDGPSLRALGELGERGRTTVRALPALRRTIRGTPMRVSDLLRVGFGRRIDTGYTWVRVRMEDPSSPRQWLPTSPSDVRDALIEDVRAHLATLSQWDQGIRQMQWGNERDAAERVWKNELAILQDRALERYGCLVEYHGPGSYKVTPFNVDAWKRGYVQMLLNSWSARTRMLRDRRGSPLTEEEKQTIRAEADEIARIAEDADLELEIDGVNGTGRLLGAEADGEQELIRQIRERRRDRLSHHVRDLQERYSTFQRQELSPTDPERRRLEQEFGREKWRLQLMAEDLERSRFIRSAVSALRPLDSKLAVVNTNPDGTRIHFAETVGVGMSGIELLHSPAPLTSRIRPPLSDEELVRLGIGQNPHNHSVVLEMIVRLDLNPALDTSWRTAITAIRANAEQNARLIGR